MTDEEIRAENVRRFAGTIKPSWEETWFDRLPVRTRNRIRTGIGVLIGLPVGFIVGLLI